MVLILYKIVKYGKVACKFKDRQLYNIETKKC